MQPVWSRVPMEQGFYMWPIRARVGTSQSLRAEIVEVLRGRIGYDPSMMYIDTKQNCTSLNVDKMWQREWQFSGNKSEAS